MSKRGRHAMTARNFMIELLNTHAERLQEGRGRPGKQYARMFPEYAAALGPLMDLAERVNDALQPVQPSAGFRRALRDELVAAARLRHAWPETSRSWQGRRLMLAAAGGAAVTAAGIAAWVLRNRPTAPASTAS